MCNSHCKYLYFVYLLFSILYIVSFKKIIFFKKILSYFFFVFILIFLYICFLYVLQLTRVKYELQQLCHCLLWLQWCIFVCECIVISRNTYMEIFAAASRELFSQGNDR